MSDEKVSVSLNELNKAVQEHAPKFQALTASKTASQNTLPDEAKSLMTEKVEAKGITIETVDSGMESFCAICAKVRPIINIGMTFAGWVLTSSQVAMAKLWINIVYTKFVDKVCKA